MPQKLTPEIIEAAINGFEAQKQRIDGQIAELRAILSGAPVDGPVEPKSTVEPKGKKARRKLSAAAIERIREGQRRRWAKTKHTPTVVSKAKPKAKRKLSAAGRKAIVDALKRRWAAKKAAA